MIKELNETYEPTEVLVVYTNHETSKNYIEIHDVKDGKTKEGRPLKKSTLHDLLLLCSDASEDKVPFRGLMSDQILYYNCNSFAPVLVWFEPACIRYLNFEDNDGGIKSGRAVVPSVIFSLNKKDLYVFATKYESRSEIKEDDQLYHLPLPNIYDDARVCMGSVDMDIPANINSVESMVELFSKRFWDSNFTDFHIKQPIKIRNVYEFWKGQIKNKLSFPREVLLEVRKKTVKSICKE